MANFQLQTGFADLSGWTLQQTKKKLKGWKSTSGKAICALTEVLDIDQDDLLSIDDNGTMNYNDYFNKVKGKANNTKYMHMSFPVLRDNKEVWTEFSWKHETWIEEDLDLCEVFNDFELFLARQGWDLSMLHQMSTL